MTDYCRQPQRRVYAGPRVQQVHHARRVHPLAIEALFGGPAPRSRSEMNLLEKAETAR